MRKWIHMGMTHWEFLVHPKLLRHSGIHSGTQTVPHLSANHPPTYLQNPLMLSTHQTALSTPLSPALRPRSEQTWRAGGIQECCEKFLAVWQSIALSGSFAPHSFELETGYKPALASKGLFVTWECECAKLHCWHLQMDGTEIWSVEEADGYRGEIRREGRL